MAVHNDQDLEALKLKPLQLTGKELWLISLPFEVNHFTCRQHLYMVFNSHF